MRKILSLFVFSIILFLDNSFALLEIEITQGSDDAIPIGIATFENEGSLQDKACSLSVIIANDLKNSGRFSIENLSECFPESPDFISWKAKKLKMVLIGQITSLGNNSYKVIIDLFDTYNQMKIFKREYSFKRNQIRNLAHYISDAIYEQIVGDRGIFSTKIAYILAKRSGKLGYYYLQIADADGYNAGTLVTSRFPLMSPSWSPNGKKISYVSFEGHRAAIYIHDIATGNREILTKFPGINGAPAWSPDGKKMALVLTRTGYPKIYVLDIQNKQLEQLTEGWYLDTEPSWSPDGKSLLFTSNRGGSPQIYRIDLETRKIDRLTYHGSYNARAHFVPKQDAIVMLHRESGMFTIAKQNLKSGQLILLAPLGFSESPSVSPNGKMVLYATTKSQKGILAESSIDGRVRLLLPSVDGEVREPAWSPFLN